MKTPFFIFEVVFAGVGTLFLAIAGYFLYQNYLFSQSSITTKGTVVRLVGDDTATSVAEYEVEGVTYTVRSSVSSNPPAHKVGQEVEIAYLANDPSDAQFNSWFDLYFGPGMFGLLGGVFASIGYGMMVASFSRKKLVARLQTQGRRLETTFQSVQRNTNLKVNGNSPFVIVSQYKDAEANQVYVFKSENIWFDPSEYVTDKTISVLVDPSNYSKYAMDISFLPKRAN